MKRAFLILICVILLCGSAEQQIGFVKKHYADKADYMEARQRLIEAELALRFDAGITLTPEEEKANQWLMALKRDEIERTRGYFPPAHSYLKTKTKELIDQSPILEIMKRMPKGGILHLHGIALGDSQWLVSHATYQPNCYIYLGEKQRKPIPGAFRFSEKPPGNGWRLISDLRRAAKDVKEFDEEIYRSITLGEEDLDQPDIWEEFSNCFRRFVGLLSSDSVWEQYSRRMLKDLVEENVQYVESRGRLGSDKIISEIQREHPEFKVKYIWAGARSRSREQVARALDRTLESREADLYMIKGFDLVEEEDKTHSNLYFIDELLDARHKAKQRNITLPLYLHSGESNWVENENVLDAILLDAKRIGHGLTLVKHPLLMQIVKERDIAIEVCPISNQVLGYIADLRNHPAVTYINGGLPVVICPDDPGIWRCTFSYDFYVAFMAWGLDLKGLKQLAMNSLLYSAMDQEEKAQALQFWQKEWAEFIAWLNKRQG